MALPSEVFREQLRAVRRIKGWTQRQLEDALAELGVKLDATAITRMERGTRGVALDDVIAIAAALGVSPLHLIVPLGNGDTALDVAPDLNVGVADVRAWIRGQRPLRDTDDDGLFYTQTPDRDWDVIALNMGARFENREDFEATRARWERAMLRKLAADGSATEVLSVVKRQAGEQAPAADQPVVAAIVTSPLGVLVGKRNDGKPPWGFISGEIEPGESPADAAIREVKEETGLRVVAGQVIGERDHPATGKHMIYMAATPTHGTDVFVGDEDELAEVRWVGLAEADELLPGMFTPVREYLERELGEG